MPHAVETEIKTCANEKCGKEFEDVWGTMKYCSSVCKDRQKWIERSRKRNHRGGYNRKFISLSGYKPRGLILIQLPAITADLT